MTVNEKKCKCMSLLSELFSLSGPLSSTFSVEGQMFVSTDETTKQIGWPDLQIILQGRLWTTEVLKAFRFNQEVKQDIIWVLIGSSS